MNKNNLNKIFFDNMAVEGGKNWKFLLIAIVKKLKKVVSVYCRQINFYIKWVKGKYIVS